MFTKQSKPLVLALIVCIFIIGFLVFDKSNICTSNESRPVESYEAVAVHQQPPSPSVHSSPVKSKPSAMKTAPPIYQPLASKFLGPAGNSSPEEEMERIWNYVYDLQYHCDKSEYFGGRPGDGDGAYDLCLENQFWPLRSSNGYKCLAYSFGVGGNFRFDDGLATRGCEVHSFDPSIKVQDGIVRPSGVTFHKIGISNEDNDADANGWKMRTLKTLIKELKHSQNYMDYLKIDTDKPGGGGFEDFLLQELLDTGLYKCVRQFSMEIHLPAILAAPKWLERFRTMYKLMTRLNDGGWRLFNTTDNIRGARKKDPNYRMSTAKKLQLEGKRVTILWEVAFVNFNVEGHCGKFL